MKTLQKHMLLTLLTALATSCLSASEIELHIEGIKNNEGKLMVQLFKGESNYAKGTFLAAASITPQSNTSVIKFTDIKAGEYALRFFHDENNNGELETNLFGFPTEGYGFSNNAKPNFGPVPYSKMSFKVSKQDGVVVNKVQVIY